MKSNDDENIYDLRAFELFLEIYGFWKYRKLDTWEYENMYTVLYYIILYIHYTQVCNSYMNEVRSILGKYTRWRILQNIEI